MKEIFLEELLNTDNAFIKCIKYYIIDFLNIFSDYREILYKKQDINFHTLKHKNKELDTYGFFNMFFNHYIKLMHINKNSEFIFVMKKIGNYDDILNSILSMYSEFRIRFIIIENEYSNYLLNKNKDDFLCQYIFFNLFSNYQNSILISNDKYRDKMNYIELFKDSIVNLKIKSNTNEFINSEMNLKLKDTILNLMKNKKCNRCNIPKNRLII